MKALPKTPPKKESETDTESEYEEEEEEMDMNQFVSEFVEELVSGRNMQKIADKLETVQFNEKIKEDVEYLLDTTDNHIELIEKLNDHVGRVSSCQNWTYLLMLVQVLITFYTYLVMSTRI